MTQAVLPEHLANLSETEAKAAARLRDRVCRVCDDEGWTEVHHVIPEGNGGLAFYWNLILLCVRCHRLVDSAPRSAWRFLSERSRRILAALRAAKRATPRTGPSLIVDLWLALDIEIVAPSAGDLFRPKRLRGVENLLAASENPA